MDLEFLDKCTIVDLDNQIIDKDTGDTTNVIICKNQKCDYQPARTENVNGTLVAHNPKLFLPFDFLLTNLLSRNLTVIISRFRKVGSTYAWITDPETGETYYGEDYYGYHPLDENNKSVPDVEYKQYVMYSTEATDINFKVDFRGGNPNKKHLISAKIEDWWEVRVGDPYLDGIQIELREVTYL